MVLAGGVVAVTKRKAKRRAPGFAAFTAAALAIPGMSLADGIDLKPEGLGLDAAYSNYQESHGRMSVMAIQNDAALQWAGDLNFKVNTVLDYIGGGSDPMNQSLIGGASPVFYWGKGNTYGKKTGELEYSQATHGAYKGLKGGIFDQRLSVSGQLSKKFDDLTLGVNGGNSTEWDYISNFFNLDGTYDLNGKNTTLSTGFGYASETVWADGGNQGQIHQTYTNGKDIGGNKNTYQALLGVTQIIDRTSLLQANVTVSNSSGFLSDPYKSAWVNNIPGGGGFGPQNTFCTQSARFSFSPNLCADTRPGTRTQEAVLIRYVKDFEELNQAALHLDYRFYSDSWNVDSHTFEANWIQPLPYEMILSPHVRYYTQRSSFFYQGVYDSPTANGLYSSDYRLASFGAVAGGVSLNKAIIPNFNVGAGIELYDRSQGMGFMGGTGSAVDNYSFTLYSINVNLKL